MVIGGKYLARAMLCILAMFAIIPAGAQDNPRKPLVNPFRETDTNPVITVRVLVLNYDPLVPSEGNRRLHTVFRWNDPRVLAKRYQELLELASGGAVRFQVVEWRDLNEVYAQKDGYRYQPDEYVRLRRAGKGWHDGGGQDYPRLLNEQGVPALVDAPVDDPRRVDEVWIFGDHFFGLWEASMAGPGAFFINGGVYPEVQTKHPFAFYGFNYERGVAEMLHNTSHRTEATLNRVFGNWKLENPVNDWELFSANFNQSKGFAGVGTCHWPPNADHDYDYANPRVVQSWAEDFLNYPDLHCRDRKGGIAPVSNANWSVPIYGAIDPHLGYMLWYFTLLPRAPGSSSDGRQYNWWKYVYDFRHYGKPSPAKAPLPRSGNDSEGSAARAPLGRPIADGKTVPASVQKEIRAAYQRLADAYQQKKPEAVLEHFTEDFKSTTVGQSEKPEIYNRDTYEKEVRSWFPGNEHGPSMSYDLRAFKPAGPNAVTVVLWSYGTYPINGKDPASGNVTGEYSAVHRWVNQGGWKLREELLKAGVKTPAPSKQMISGRP